MDLAPNSMLRTCFDARDDGILFGFRSLTSMLRTCFEAQDDWAVSIYDQLAQQKHVRGVGKRF